jgi:glycosyltransferase involved in cell wall biosynthesis
MESTKTLLVHQFPLSHVTGVTVMLREILRLIPAVAGGVADYQSFPATIEELLTELDLRHRDSARIVGFNLHIEVQWDFSLALVNWCAQRGIPFWVYIHDYWPHNRANVTALAARDVKLLASTPFVCGALIADGFSAEVVPVGVPLPAGAPPDLLLPRTPKTFASAGRLAPRKRYADIARAFREAAFDAGEGVGLYLRLLPSRVFGSNADAAQLRLLEDEIPAAFRDNGMVRLDHVASTEPFDYAPYFAYICSSSYEGFSMSPIEAAYSGCPPLMSDIAAHRAIADSLFGEQGGDFLYPVEDTPALARLMRDEVATQRRRNLIASHGADIRRTIRSKYSLETTAQALSGLGAAA